MYGRRRRRVRRVKRFAPGVTAELVRAELERLQQEHAEMCEEDVDQSDSSLWAESLNDLEHDIQACERKIKRLERSAQ